MGSQIELGGKANFAQMRREYEKMTKTIERQEKMLKRVTKENTKLERETRKTGQAHEESFGSKGVASLARFATGVVSATTAVSFLRRELEAVSAARERGVAGARAAETPIAELGQITGPGLPLAELRNLTTQFRIRAGVGVEQATDVVKKAQSRQLLGTLPFIADLNPTISPVPLVDAIGAVQSGFGRAEAGGGREITNKLIAGARISALTATDFAEVIGGLGPAFSKFGGSDEEAIAALAAAAGAQGGKVGATSVARFVDFLSQPKQKRFQGGTFVEGFDLFAQRAEGKTTSQLARLIPEKRAAKGFQFLKANRKLFGQAFADVTAAGAAGPGGDLVRQKILERGTDIDLAIGGFERTAKQQLAISEENLPAARASRLSEALKDKILFGGRRAGLSEFDVSGLLSNLEFEQLLRFKTNEPAAILAQGRKLLTEEEQVKASELVLRLEGAVSGVPGAATLGGRAEPTTTHTGFGGPEK